MILIFEAYTLKNPSTKTVQCLFAPAVTTVVYRAIQPEI
jgi:hypothetical protein